MQYKRGVSIIFKEECLLLSERDFKGKRRKKIIYNQY